MKKGVELEYWVIDEKGRLENAEKVSKEFEFAHPEFVKPLLEIKTDPQVNLDELREEMFDRVRRCFDKAREKNLRLVPTGTPLNSERIEIIPGSGRVELEKRFFPEHNIKDRSRAGTHVHFEKFDTIKQLNLLTALDPASALLNSSPFHKGEKIASSSRNYFYRYKWKCQFPEHISLWDYADSAEEWESRTQERFNELREAAIENGIESAQFEEHYSADDSVWIPIRLRNNFGTVEWRSGDAAIPSQVFKLVKKISQILESSRDKELGFADETVVDDEKIILPRFDRLEELSKEASLEGLMSDEVSNYLKKLSFNLDQYNPLTENLSDKNNLELEEARELRLKASKILEEDLER